MADVSVQRGVNDVANTTATDTGFTAVGSLNSAFELISNSRYGTAGSSTTNSTNYEIDDIGGRVELTATSTLTLTRLATGNTATFRFAWEILEYTGSASGANEFIVRSRNTISMTGSSASASLDNTPAAGADCIPFITGVTNSDTSDDADEACVVANISSDGTSVEVRRGGTNGTTIVQVVTVEFTGSNWSVFHGTSTSSGDTGTITLNTASDGSAGSTGDVSSWSNAFIVGSLTSTDHGLDSVGALYEPGSGTTAVDWTLNSGNSSSHEHFVHVLHNADMTVTRYQNTSSTAGATNVDVTSAGLTNISEASVIGFSITSGGGTAYGRGWRNFRLTSTTNVEHWCHRSGNTMAHEIQVIDFSGVEDAGGGGSYTLVAEAGSFAWAGSDAGLRASRKINAEAGSFAWTGSDVTLKASRKFDAEAGSFSWQGEDASLRHNKRLQAETGSFELTGNDADLKASRILNAEAGSFDLTGMDVTFTTSQVEEEQQTPNQKHSIRKNAIGLRM